MIFFSKLKTYIPAIIWLLIILFLSGYPGHKVPSAPFLEFDKLVHSAIYGVLSVLLLVAFHRQYQEQQSRYSTIISIICFSISYGGIMEILQHYIFINRSGNWYDFMANTFGAILGVLMYPYILKYLPIKKWFGIK